MKEALALLINDIHISKDNIDEFNKNWNEAVKICQMEGISEIIVGGDMFTERSSQTLAVLLAVKHALDYAVHRGIRVTIAEGNHDIVDKEAFEGYNHLWRFTYIELSLHPWSKSHLIMVNNPLTY